MSKLLLSYTDEKDVNTFVGIINDINQIAKTLKSDNIYSMENGICYAYKTNIKDVLHQELTFDFESNRNKKAYNDSVQFLNGVVNGKDLFDWFKDAKKHINKIEMYDDHYTLYTTNNNISFSSLPLDEKGRSVDIDKMNSYLERIDSKKNIIFENDNFEEEINKIDFSTMIIPYEFKFPYKIKKKDGSKVTKYIHFRITKRMLPTLKKESKVHFKIYPIDAKNKVFQIIYTIDNKVSKLKNYATIINY